jgi:hypothetical protein
MVDAFVLSQLRLASPSLYRDLRDGPCAVADSSADDNVRALMQSMPPEWCANVVE